jgi:sugar lactone lactonase YvrE
VSLLRPFLVGLLFLLDLPPLRAHTISTIAGNGLFAKAGDGVPAISSPLYLGEGTPARVVFDADGNLYFSESAAHRVRKIERKTGLLFTVAGTGRAGFSGDGKPATTARLSEPGDLAFDRAGNLYIADLGNRRIRRIDRKSGIIETYAGSGAPIFTKDGSPARDTPMGRPSGIAFDAAGNLFVVECFSGRILRIDAKTTIVTTIVGNGTIELQPNAKKGTETGLPAPSSAAMTSKGEIVFSVTGQHILMKADPATGALTWIAGTGIPGDTGDGGPALKAQLSQPAAIAIDRDDNIWFIDWENNAVRRIDGRTGIIETRVGSSRRNRWGEIETAGFSGDGGPADRAQLWHPTALGIDREGDLYIVDARNQRIRRVEKAAP